MTISGIYKICNINTNQFYIGSGSSLKQRKSQHWGLLKYGNHYNKKLQNSWNKHGESSFVFEIIEECEECKLVEREQHYIDTLKPFYNIRKEVTSNKGLKRSKQTVELWRKSRLSKPITAWNKGLKLGQQSEQQVLKRVLSNSRRRKQIVPSKKSVKWVISSKPVYQYSSDWTQLIATYKTTTECQYLTGFYNIHTSCTKERLSYGFRWSYENKFEKKKSLNLTQIGN